MSCKSALYTASTTATTVTLTAAQPTAVLPLGTTVRRFGCSVSQSGDGVLLKERGYYEVETNVVITPAAAGTYTVTIFADGSPVQGATQTVTATAGATLGINVPAMVRLQCCDSATTLTLRLSTTATLPATIAVNNTAVVVEKL